MNPNNFEVVWRHGAFLFLYLKTVIWWHCSCPGSPIHGTAFVIIVLHEETDCWVLSTRRLSVASVSTSYFAIIFKLRSGTTIPLIISPSPTHSQHSWHRVGAQSLFWVNERRNKDHHGNWSRVLQAQWFRKRLQRWISCSTCCSYNCHISSS